MILSAFGHQTPTARDHQIGIIFQSDPSASGGICFLVALIHVDDVGTLQNNVYIGIFPAHAATHLVPLHIKIRRLDRHVVQDKSNFFRCSNTDHFSCWGIFIPISFDLGPCPGNGVRSACRDLNFFTIIIAAHLLCDFPLLAGDGQPEVGSA